MNSITPVRSSFIFIPSEEVDKENIRPQSLEQRTSAVATKIMWSQEPDAVVIIENKEDLAAEDIWHDLNALGFDAMIARGNLSELQEYADSYLMLQDPSEDGIVCPLENPAKYDFAFVKSVFDSYHAERVKRKIIDSIEHLSEEELNALIVKMQEIMNERASESRSSSYFKPIDG